MMNQRLVIFATLVGSAVGKLGTTFGLGMRHGHNLTAAQAAQGLDGSVMQRVFTTYADLPVGELALQDAGWTKHGTECDPYLGYAWTEDAKGPTRSKPLLLYTTEDGQPAGVGTVYVDAMPANQMKWTTTKPLKAYSGSETVYHVDVAFRSSNVCTQGAGHSGLGDVLIVNPAGEHTKEIPLTYEQPWQWGSCFEGMGTHAFLNSVDPTSSMPWKSSDLFPVVAMYHEEKVSAIFFAAVKGQITLPFVAANWWEPVSLDNDNMCVNHCDPNCGFSDNGKGDWGTMHIYFNNWRDVQCPADYRCAIRFPSKAGCCPATLGLQEEPENAYAEIPRLLSVLGMLLGAGIVSGFALRRRSIQDAREVRVSEMTGLSIAA